MTADLVQGGGGRTTVSLSNIPTDVVEVTVLEPETITVGTNPSNATITASSSKPNVAKVVVNGKKNNNNSS